MKDIQWSMTRQRRWVRNSGSEEDAKINTYLINSMPTFHGEMTATGVDNDDCSLMARQFLPLHLPSGGLLENTLIVLSDYDFSLYLGWLWVFGSRGEEDERRGRGFYLYLYIY